MAFYRGRSAVLGVVTREWGEVVYAPEAQPGAKIIRLDDAERHHLLRVLRVRAGESLVAVNGSGAAFHCLVQASGDLTVESEAAEWGEESRSIHVGCALLRGDGLRHVVDTATVLGAASIHIFRAARSEGNFSDEKSERLQRVAIASMKQCGRSRLPEIKFASNFEAARAGLSEYGGCFAAHPVNHKPEDLPRSKAAVFDKHCALFIGPEGGFTDREIEVFLLAGGKLLDLGQRRLRSELAVAAGIERLRNLMNTIDS